MLKVSRVTSPSSNATINFFVVWSKLYEKKVKSFQFKIERVLKVTAMTTLKVRHGFSLHNWNRFSIQNLQITSW